MALHSLIAARAAPCHWATPGCPVQAKFTYKRTLVTVYAMVGIKGQANLTTTLFTVTIEMCIMGGIRPHKCATCRSHTGEAIVVGLTNARLDHRIPRMSAQDVPLKRHLLLSLLGALQFSPFAT